jgi:holo-[acyl-carrier protein] synthase
MIIGIGSDLIDITRVAKVIERHGDRFLDRIFTDAERAKATRRANSEKMVVATYAKRFAAKEACSKALGTGIRRGVCDCGATVLGGARPGIDAGTGSPTTGLARPRHNFGRAALERAGASRSGKTKSP